MIFQDLIWIQPAGEDGLQGCRGTGLDNIDLMLQASAVDLNLQLGSTFIVMASL